MSPQIEYTGNSIPAPGYAKGGVTTNDELLYSHDHNYVQKGVTLKAGQGVLLLGTLLKRDATSKRYVKTTTPGDALGILRKTTDTGTDEEGQEWQANILYGGVLKLAPVKAANSGVTLTSVLGGRVNEVEGFFKF
jgi:hypothetical protein